jgi:hypothetical protein
MNLENVQVAKLSVLQPKIEHSPFQGQTVGLQPWLAEHLLAK